MAAASILLSRQSQRLLQIGVALLLLLSLEGFAIPHLAAPLLGVSAHKLAALQSVLLLALGLVWPKLNLSAAISRIAFWLSSMQPSPFWPPSSSVLSGERATKLCRWPQGPRTGPHFRKP